MSRIYFSAIDDEAEVWGGERAHLAQLTNRMGMAALNHGYTGGLHPIARVLDDSSHYAKFIKVERRPGERVQDWYDRLRTSDESVRSLFLMGGFLGEHLVNFGGLQYELADLMANTCITLGELPALVAKIHFTCEAFGYVEWADRIWLADLIERAIDVGILREKLKVGDTWQPMWGDVLRLLRRRDSNYNPDGHVFMHYSVTESFAGRPPDSWRPDLEDRDENWYELSYEERWKISADYTRSEHPYLRLSPDTITTPVFDGRGNRPATLWDMIRSPEWMGTDAQVSG